MLRPGLLLRLAVWMFVKELKDVNLFQYFTLSGIRIPDSGKFLLLEFGILLRESEIPLTTGNQN